MSRPVASTYRLQMHAGFTFDDARALLPYLHRLGVTHLYLSPIATATPGSTHGYDVTDPRTVNPELGGVEAFWRLVEEERRLGMGQILDIVPNHMGVALGAGNAYWEDVLRHGRGSRYAPLFDIEWEPDDAPDLTGRVLLPVLASPLDDALAAGEVGVEDGAEPSLRVGEQRLPLAAESVEAWRAAGAPSDLDGLRALLARQHYRLEHWYSAHHRLNYRRFFAVDNLAGLNVHEPAVFDLVHALPLALVRDGAVDGLRIDHPDGIRDVEAYLRRLRAGLADAGAPDAYVVIEKILAAEEPLPSAWDCDGTTGYEFMNEVLRVLTADAGERFEAAQEALTGRAFDPDALEDECRGFVTREAFGTQFERLGRALRRAAQEAATADDGEDAAPFVAALQALLASLPRYRTYHRDDALDGGASAVVAGALARATMRQPALRAPLERVAGLLEAPPPGAARAVVMRLQQVMPAVQAKGLEDRAFFRERRLMALNEVGGDLTYFSEPVETFHARNVEAARAWPRRMTTTATHDHKRGEDARLRIAALSQMPEEWEEAARRAFAALAPARAAAPRVTDSDVYALLQGLLGVAPAGMAGAREGEDDLLGRMRAYMRKVVREAGEHSDWLGPDEEYERQLASVVAAAVEGETVLHALGSVVPRAAHLGALASLSQVVLKMASPGVPDTYQGSEGWDLSLVDPDNRRPPDYALLRRRLDDLGVALDEGAAAEEARRTSLPTLVGRWHDGALKTYVVARALAVRRARPALFLEGAYEPLALRGDAPLHALSFVRRHEGTAALVVATRLHRGVLETEREWWNARWGDTHITLPDGLAGREWIGEFDGVPRAPAAALHLRDLLRALPVTLLTAR